MIINLITSLLYKILLDFLYPIMFYTLKRGGGSAEFNFFRWRFGCTLIIVLGLFLNLFFKKNNPIKKYIFLLNYLIFFPLTTLYSYREDSNKLFLITVFSCFIIFSLSVVFFNSLFNLVKNIRINNLKKIILVLIWLIIVLNFIVIIKKFGSFFNLELLTYYGIYKIREQNHLTGLLGYTLNWQIFVCHPILIYESYVNKNFLLFIFIIFLQIFIFVFFPFRIFLVYLALNILVICFKNLEKLNLILKLIFSITLLGGVVIENVKYRALLDRAFYLPSLINYQYFDFFSKNTFNYFQNSKLGIFFEQQNIYEMDYPRIIGLIYYGSATRFVMKSYDMLKVA